MKGLCKMSVVLMAFLALTVASYGQTVYTWDGSTWSPSDPNAEATITDAELVILGGGAYVSKPLAGEITIRGGNLDISGGGATTVTKLTLDGATINFGATAPGTIDEVNFAGAVGTTISVAAGSTLTVNLIATTDPAQTITKTGAGTLNLAGTVSNVDSHIIMSAGTLQLSKSGTAVAIGADLTVNGGDVVFSGSGENQLDIDVNVIFNNTATSTFNLNGKTQKTFASLSLNGTGTCNISGAGTMTVEKLSVNGPTTIANSTFNVLTEITNANSLTLNGTTCTLGSGGAFNNNAGASLLISASGSLKIDRNSSDGPATLTNNGTITNTGSTLLINGIFNNETGAALNLQMGATFQTSTAAVFTHRGNLIYNDGTTKLEGTTTLIADFTNGFSFENKGALTIQSGATFTNSSSSSTNSGVITNQGTFANSANLTNSGSFVNDGAFSNTSTAAVVTSGTFTNNAGKAANGGTHTVTGNGVFDNSGDMTGKINATSTNSKVINHNGATMTLDIADSQSAGTFTNDGTVTCSTAFTLNGTLNNTGTFSFNGAGKVFTMGQPAKLNNSGNFNMAANQLKNAGNLNNSGTFSAASGSTITNTKTIVNSGNFNLSGTLKHEKGALVNESSATLTVNTGALIQAGCLATIENNGVISNSGRIELATLITGNDVTNAGGVVVLPTPVTAPDCGGLQLAKQLTSTASDGTWVTYTVHYRLKNNGTLELHNIKIIDNIKGMFGSVVETGSFTCTPKPATLTFTNPASGTLVLNAANDGAKTNILMDNTGGLQAGQIVEFDIVYRVKPKNTLLPNQTFQTVATVTAQNQCNVTTDITYSVNGSTFGQTLTGTATAMPLTAVICDIVPAMSVAESETSASKNPMFFRIRRVGSLNLNTNVTLTITGRANNSSTWYANLGNSYNDATDHNRIDAYFTEAGTYTAPNPVSPAAPGGSMVYNYTFSQLVSGDPTDAQKEKKYPLTVVNDEVYELNEYMQTSLSGMDFTQPANSTTVFITPNQSPYITSEEAKPSFNLADSKGWDSYEEGTGNADGRLTPQRCVMLRGTLSSPHYANVQVSVKLINPSTGAVVVSGNQLTLSDYTVIQDFIDTVQPAPHNFVNPASLEKFDIPSLSLKDSIKVCFRMDDVQEGKTTAPPSEKFRVQSDANNSVALGEHAKIDYKIRDDDKRELDWLDDTPMTPRSISEKLFKETDYVDTVHIWFYVVQAIYGGVRVEVNVPQGIEFAATSAPYPTLPGTTNVVNLADQGSTNMKGGHGVAFEFAGYLRNDGTITGKTDPRPNATGSNTLIFKPCNGITQIQFNDLVNFKFLTRARCDAVQTQNTSTVRVKYNTHAQANMISASDTEGKNSWIYQQDTYGGDMSVDGTRSLIFASDETEAERKKPAFIRVSNTGTAYITTNGIGGSDVMWAEVQYSKAFVKRLNDIKFVAYDDMGTVEVSETFPASQISYTPSVDPNPVKIRFNITQAMIEKIGNKDKNLDNGEYFDITFEVEAKTKRELSETASLTCGKGNMTYRAHWACETPEVVLNNSLDVYRTAGVPAVGRYVYPLDNFFENIDTLRARFRLDNHGTAPAFRLNGGYSIQERSGLTHVHSVDYKITHWKGTNRNLRRYRDNNPYLSGYRFFDLRKLGKGITGVVLNEAEPGFANNLIFGEMIGEGDTVYITVNMTRTSIDVHEDLSTTNGKPGSVNNATEGYRFVDQWCTGLGYNDECEELTNLGVYQFQVIGPSTIPQISINNTSLIDLSDNPGGVLPADYEIEFGDQYGGQPMSEGQFAEIQTYGAASADSAGHGYFVLNFDVAHNGSQMPPPIVSPGNLLTFGNIGLYEPRRTDGTQAEPLSWDKRPWGGIITGTNETINNIFEVECSSDGISYTKISGEGADYSGKRFWRIKMYNVPTKYLQKGAKILVRFIGQCNGMKKTLSHNVRYTMDMHTRSTGTLYDGSDYNGVTHEMYKVNTITTVKCKSEPGLNIKYSDARRITVFKGDGNNNGIDEGGYIGQNSTPPVTDGDTTGFVNPSATPPVNKEMALKRMVYMDTILFTTASRLSKYPLKAGSIKDVYAAGDAPNGTSFSVTPTKYEDISPTTSITAAGTGCKATFTVDASYKIQDFYFSNVGSGYAVGDVLTFTVSGVSFNVTVQSVSTASEAKEWKYLYIVLADKSKVLSNTGGYDPTEETFKHVETEVDVYHVNGGWLPGTSDPKYPTVPSFTLNSKGANFTGPTWKTPTSSPIDSNYVYVRFENLVSPNDFFDNDSIVIRSRWMYNDGIGRNGYDNNFTSSIKFWNYVWNEDRGDSWNQPFPYDDGKPGSHYKDNLHPDGYDPYMPEAQMTSFGEFPMEFMTFYVGSHNYSTDFGFYKAHFTKSQPVFASFYSAVGNNFSDQLSFPFELRQFYYPDSFKVTLPFGYVLKTPVNYFPFSRVPAAQVGKYLYDIAPPDSSLQDGVTPVEFSTKANNLWNMNLRDGFTYDANSLKMVADEAWEMGAPQLQVKVTPKAAQAGSEAKVHVTFESPYGLPKQTIDVGMSLINNTPMLKLEHSPDIFEAKGSDTVVWTIRATNTSSVTGQDIIEPWIYVDLPHFRPLWVSENGVKTPTFDKDHNEHYEGQGYEGRWLRLCDVITAYPAKVRMFDIVCVYDHASCDSIDTVRIIPWFNGVDELSVSLEDRVIPLTAQVGSHAPSENWYVNNPIDTTMVITDPEYDVWLGKTGIVQVLNFGSRINTEISPLYNTPNNPKNPKSGGVIPQYGEAARDTSLAGGTYYDVASSNDVRLGKEFPVEIIVRNTDVRGMRDVNLDLVMPQGVEYVHNSAYYQWTAKEQSAKADTLKFKDEGEQVMRRFDGSTNQTLERLEKIWLKEITGRDTIPGTVFNNVARGDRANAAREWTVYLRFRVKTDCNEFKADSSHLSVYQHANRLCEKPAAGDGDTIVGDRITIEGFRYYKWSQEMTSTSGRDFSFCMPRRTITARFFRNGAKPIMDDSMVLKLPPQFKLDTASWKLNGTVGPVRYDHQQTNPNENTPGVGVSPWHNPDPGKSVDGDPPEYHVYKDPASDSTIVSWGAPRKYGAEYRMNLEILYNIDVELDTTLNLDDYVYQQNFRMYTVAVADTFCDPNGLWGGVLAQCEMDVFTHTAKLGLSKETYIEVDPIKKTDFIVTNRYILNNLSTGPINNILLSDPIAPLFRDVWTSDPMIDILPVDENSTDGRLTITVTDSTLTTPLYDASLPAALRDTISDIAIDSSFVGDGYLVQGGSLAGGRIAVITVKYRARPNNFYTGLKFKNNATVTALNYTGCAMSDTSNWSDSTTPYSKKYDVSREPDNIQTLVKDEPSDEAFNTDDNPYNNDVMTPVQFSIIRFTIPMIEHSAPGNDYGSSVGEDLDELNIQIERLGDQTASVDIKFTGLESGFAEAHKTTLYSLNDSLAWLGTAPDCGVDAYREKLFETIPDELWVEDQANPETKSKAKVKIFINDDPINETNESFYASLSNQPPHVALTNDTVSVTIGASDSRPKISIYAMNKDGSLNPLSNDPATADSIKEGTVVLGPDHDYGTKPAAFAIKLSNPTYQQVSVDWTTSGGTLDPQVDPWAGYIQMPETTATFTMPSATDGCRQSDTLLFVDVMVISDSISEKASLMQVELVSGSVPEYPANVGSIPATLDNNKRQANLWIVDDDIKLDTLALRTLICKGDNTGLLNVRARGGETGASGKYHYDWTYPDGTTKNEFDVASLQENIAAGWYEVKVTDVWSDPTDTIFKIFVNEPSKQLGIHIDSLQDQTCWWRRDGLVHVTFEGGWNGATAATDAGLPDREVSPLPPYVISWTKKDSAYFTSAFEDLDSLWSGTYILNMVDTAGCSIDTEVEINKPKRLELIDTTLLNVICKSDANGSIQISVKNGVWFDSPADPYSVAWAGPTGYVNTTWTGPSSYAEEMPSQTTIDNLKAGIYTLMLTDDNCDTLTQTYEILEPAAPFVAYLDSVGRVACKGGATGVIIVHAEGGWGNYLYSWNGPSATEQDDTVSHHYDLTAGDYSITFSDSELGDDRKCVLTLDTVVHEPEEALEMKFVLKDESYANGNDGSVIAAVYGGKPFDGISYDLVWHDDPSIKVAERYNLNAGTYVLTATDSWNCALTDSAVIHEPDVTENLPNAFTPNGDGFNDLLLEHYDIKVYDRWGLLLYEGKDGWDGRYKGKLMPPATYFYVLINEEGKVFKSSVLLQMEKEE